MSGSPARAFLNRVAAPLRARGTRGLALRAAALGTALGGLVALGALPEGAGPPPEWTPYSPVVLERAKADGRPVVVDFYADWCLPCLRLEAVTFSSPEVHEAAHGVLMVKADVTDDAAEASREARQRFAVEALPVVVFLDGRGRERDDLRVASFVSPAEMRARIRALRGDTR